jgi:hypothetical protein
MRETLLQFQQQRSLVSLRRSAIDDSAIQCFVLGASDQLVLLQYVYDFHLDGMMVLRVGDVSDVTRSKTDEFQERLLAAEGLLTQVPFDYALDLSNWRHAITELSGIHPLLQLECELLDDPDFVIGRTLAFDEEQVTLQYFTGVANWLEEPISVRYDDLTSCQVNNNYMNVYQRHFKRQAH